MGGSRERSPPKVSRQQIPYVLGPVDAREPSAGPRRQQPGDPRIVDLDAQQPLGLHDVVHQRVDDAAVAEQRDGVLVGGGRDDVVDACLDPGDERVLVDPAGQMAVDIEPLRSSCEASSIGV